MMFGWSICFRIDIYTKILCSSSFISELFFIDFIALTKLEPLSATFDTVPNAPLPNSATISY
jgi:hypothetical protein